MVATARTHTSVNLFARLATLFGVISGVRTFGQRDVYASEGDARLAVQTCAALTRMHVRSIERALV